ncbi:MAG: DUF2975 domain-containing protein [Pseudomonadota bacterium]
MTKRIRLGILILVCLGILLVVNMMFNYVRWTIPNAFIDLDRLPRAYGYGPDEDFPFFNRLFFFVFVTMSVLSGLIAVGIGFRLMRLFWNGVFFEHATTTTIRWLGISLMAVAVISILYGNVVPYVLTQARASGGLPMYPVLNSYDLGYALCGVLMFMIGWVLGEALRIEQENKEFV